MINSHTQRYIVGTPNSLCLKVPIKKFHSASVKCSHQVPLHFPTGKGHTSGSVEKSVGALPSEQSCEYHKGEDLWALSSVPLEGGAGTAAEPQESSKGLTQDRCSQGCRMIDFGQQSGSLLAITQLNNSWAFFPKVQEQWCPSLGYDSGKWFTKASEEYCLSFVSHLVWVADVSDWMHQFKYISFTHYSSKIIPFNYSFILSFFHILIQFKLPNNWILQSAHKGLFSEYKTR